MAQIQLTPDILTAALEGFEIQKRRIDEQLAQIRAIMGGQPAPAAEPKGGIRKVGAKKSGRRELSEAARERIAEAQRKRWAAYRKEKQKA